MHITNWKKEIWTIPNLLSLFRLALIPVYLTLYLDEDYALSAVILGLSCLTDLVDGQIARRFNMVTKLGKVLDPLADKLTQLVMMICLSLRYRVLKYLIVLFLIKEFFQLFAMLGAMQHGKALDGALMSGKISTTVLFVSLIVMVLLPDLPAPLVSAISLVCLVFLLFAFGDYILAYFGKNKKIYDLE